MVFNTGAALLDAIVLAVVSKEEEGTYGYKITQDVRKAIEVSESTLYPVLRRLQKDNLFLGLSLGSNVVIAQFIGARQSERVGAAVQTSFILALFTGLGIAVIGEILTGPIINWLEVPLEVKAMATMCR